MLGSFISNNEFLSVSASDNFSASAKDSVEVSETGANLQPE